MSTPKAQFQVDHGSGWETIAEVDIIDGIVQPPNAWTMVRALGKRIVYTGHAPEKITVVPSNPRDTHFAGFAREVVKELLGLRWQTVYYRDPLMLEHYEQVIAHRAYDLAVHILNNMPSSAAAYEAPEVLRWVPDLTELPEEDKL